MVSLELFAKMYVPVGYIVGMGCLWYILSVLFKDETTIEDILGAGILSFLFGYNLMFILWGVSLLNA